MSKAIHPQQPSRKPPPKPTRGTLAAAVGGLPLPPRLAKPPAPRVSKPPLIALLKPSASKPHPPKPNKPASSSKALKSVAGRLGAFAVKRAKSGVPKGGAGRKRG